MKKNCFVNLDGYVTMFVKDEVSHAAVNKEVAEELVLAHWPIPGIEQPGLI